MFYPTLFGILKHMLGEKKHSMVLLESWCPFFVSVEVKACQKWLASPVKLLLCILKLQVLPCVCTISFYPLVSLLLFR